MVTRVDLIRLIVNDLRLSREFYDLIGFSRVLRSGQYVDARFGDRTLHLVAREDTSPVSDTADSPQEFELRSCLFLNDLLERLRTLHIPPESSPSIDHENSEARVMIRDPDGNLVAVNCPLGEADVASIDATMSGFQDFEPIDLDESDFIL